MKKKIIVSTVILIILITIIIIICKKNKLNNEENNTNAINNNLTFKINNDSLNTTYDVYRDGKIIDTVDESMIQLYKDNPDFDPLYLPN